jgi:galactonate dehydratase
MKLVKATAFAIRTPPPNLGGYRWYFVKLETDSGIVGWGECAVLFSMYGMEASFNHLVQDTFQRYLNNKNPLNRSALTKQVYEGLGSENPGYFASGVISALDMAMWDIAGKYFESPICDLIGGRFRDKIRCYSYIYDIDSQGSLNDAIAEWQNHPKKIGESARKLADEGFTGLKLDPVPYKGLGTDFNVYPREISLNDYDNAERTIEAIRESLGNDCDILVGTHGQITPSSARRLAQRLEKYDPLWLEEPCPPENVEEMARIAASTTIPIATGERLAWTHQFRPLFTAGACHFAQPDLGSCGGVTAAMEIAALAESHYILMAPHVWGGPLITAAALQLDAAIPNFLIQESIYKSNLFFDELCIETFNWEDGYLHVPEGPGLGINLNENALEKHAIT